MGFEIINAIKKEKGLTNAQIAQMSGVTLSTLDKITSGANTNPKLDTLQAICTVLGCTLNDFVDAPGVAEPTPSNKKTPLCSSEAMKLAQDYDGLDGHGKKAVRAVADVEIARCAEQAQTAPARTTTRLYVAARDGSRFETEVEGELIIPDESDEIP